MIDRKGIGLDVSAAANCEKHIGFRELEENESGFRSFVDRDSAAVTIGNERREQGQDDVNKGRNAAGKNHD